VFGLRDAQGRAACALALDMVSAQLVAVAATRRSGRRPAACLWEPPDRAPDPVTDEQEGNRRKQP
jgi:hypothetical protein